MLRVIIVAVLMLSMAVVLTAQYGGISREEFSRRHEELRAQAEQIKQETRFEGTISNYPPENRIISFRGSFEDIRVPAREDTSGFEQVFDEILDRILPYFPVDRADLIKEHVISNVASTSISFKQTANGYDIEGASRIVVGYTHSLENFFISNDLAYLDPAQLPTEPRITEEEAIRIYYENVDVPDDKIEITRYQPNFKLMYSLDRDRDTGEVRYGRYRLSWIGRGYGGRFIVDALTGEIIAHYSEVRGAHTVNVQGTVYRNTDHIIYDDTPETLDIHRCEIWYRNNGQWNENPLYVDFGSVTIPNNPVDVDSIVTVLHSDQFLTSYSNGQDIFIGVVPNDPASSDTLLVFQPDHSHIFWTARSFYDFLSTLNPVYTIELFPLKISSGHIGLQHNGVSYLGYFDPNVAIIKLDDTVGKLRSWVCHEMTHAFVFYTLNGFFNSLLPYSDSRDAMDEAFSTYLPCSYLTHPISRRTPNAWDYRNITNKTVEWVAQNLFVPPIPMNDINEIFYAHYNNGYPIASALWALRGLPDFDQTIINILRERVGGLSPTIRYRPRAFFNLLMEHYPDDRQAITTAYADRGLHFVPEVKITNSADPQANPKSEFEEGEQVWLQITNLPQNTDFHIYLIEKKQQYTIRGDGFNLNSIQAIDEIDLVYILAVDEQNYPLKSDASGVWIGRLFGETKYNKEGYIVVVDIGYGAPDGWFYCEYQPQAVIDAKAEFKVKYPYSIDVVLAVDISESMTSIYENIRPTVRRIISSLKQGDRINVFGFSNLNNRRDWIHGDTITDMVEVSEPISLAHTIYFPGNPDNPNFPFWLPPPTRILEGALHNGFERFDIVDNPRNKALFILSDGRDTVHPDFPPPLIFRITMTISTIIMYQMI